MGPDKEIAAGEGVAGRGPELKVKGGDWNIPLTRTLRSHPLTDCGRRVSQTEKCLKGRENVSTPKCCSIDIHIAIDSSFIEERRWFGSVGPRVLLLKSDGNTIIKCRRCLYSRVSDIYYRISRSLHYVLLWITTFCYYYYYYCYRILSTAEGKSDDEDGEVVVEASGEIKWAETKRGVTNMTRGTCTI